MTRKKEHGDLAENLAASFLETQGYKILYRNFRSGRNEIDLIVKKEALLVFVEVRYRSGLHYGMPEITVDEHKEERIRICAEDYLEEKKWEGPIRFDILAISGAIENPLIDHFIDAF